MSEPTCHSVGINGHCGLDCPVLQAGDCDSPPVPDSIFLQIEYDGYLDPSGWTFCADRINDSDIKYIQEGLVPKLKHAASAIGSLVLPSGDFVHLEHYLFADWETDNKGKRCFVVKLEKFSYGYTRRYYGEDAKMIAAYLRSRSAQMED